MRVLLAIALAWLLASPAPPPPAPSPSPLTAPASPSPASTATTAAFDTWWPATIARLERAVVTGSSPELQAVRARLQQALESTLTPRQAVLVRYALAYVDWRLAPTAGLKRSERKALLEEGSTRIGEALALEPQNAELHAMSGAILGFHMGMTPSLGMEFGPKAAASMEQAQRLAPHNPRVTFLAGLSAFHTPPAYGGSTEKAEVAFRQALVLFGAEPADRPWPNWGRLDTYVWLGQLLEKRNDAAGARKLYQQALALAPDFAWVRDNLLPRLELKNAPR